MGTILCIVDGERTREHAEDKNGKGSRCEPKFLGWVGWERKHKFKANIDGGENPKAKAFLDAGNAMVLVEGTRYDIGFESERKVKWVHKVTIREMFRLKKNGESELDDIHWKSRPKSDVCAIWSTAKLDLTLWAARWNSQQDHDENSNHEAEKYGQRSESNQAPVTCNNNDPRGYLEGTQDDPTFDEIYRRQIPGYHGDASYQYCPWHCNIPWLTVQDFLNWMRAVNAQVKEELGDDEFFLWDTLSTRERNEGDVLAGPRPSVVGLATIPAQSLAPVTNQVAFSPVAANGNSMGPVTAPVGLGGPQSVVEGQRQAPPLSPIVIGLACQCDSTGCSCGETTVMTAKGARE